LIGIYKKNWQCFPSSVPFKIPRVATS